MRHHVLIPLIVACALFMENMDSTVLATSLPAIAADIGENPLALKLALTSYLVGLAIFIPISGWVADRYGSKKVFAWAIVVFLAGSIACALSSSLTFFVIARFVQGIGGAMMVPVGRLVLLKSVPKSELVSALNYLTFPALLGPVMGPPLGGLITQVFNWRGIFLINVPISLLGIYLVIRYIPDIREEELPPLDVYGFAILGLGLALTMLGLSALGGHLLSPLVTGLSIIIGAVFLFAYWRHAKRATNPLIDPAVLEYQTFRTAVIGGTLYRIGAGATPFLLPLMFQLGFGLDPFHSGLLTCTVAVGAMFMKTLTRLVLSRYGFRRVLIVNGLIASIGMAMYGMFTASTPHMVVIAVLVATGLSRSLQFTALGAIGFADIGKALMSEASSLQSMTQRLAQSLGVAVGAYALELSSQLQNHSQIVASDFWPAFVVSGLISAASLFYNLALPANAGAELAGKVEKKVKPGSDQA